MSLMFNVTQRYKKVTDEFLSGLHDIKDQRKLTLMKALIKSGKGCQVTEVPRPKISTDHDLLVQVLTAGVCKTDLWIARGKKSAPEELILGHEFCAEVVEIGEKVSSLKIGDRVTCKPEIPCHSCPSCQAGNETLCHNPALLGVSRSGAFAEYLVVPEEVVYPIPAELSAAAGAYVEPVAATLAVLETGISPEQQGLIAGGNRIAVLCYRIMQQHGFENLQLAELNGSNLQFEDSSFDYVIETALTSELMTDIIRLVRPGGTIILKSRHDLPVAVSVRELTQKELLLRAVNYGSFTDAIELISQSKIELQDLIGPSYSLEEFETVFCEEEEDESVKRFFQIGLS